ncbi:hypothetical protein LSH36_71g05103 [Paralvinella palmiformis]|uniref:Pescadillo homolog n=1 Tax=Paralvinella palmiformis TaxID=53620 RepID=A0AAD9K300_9ANNE|nr:hypothetical protein LSH36_71g05103 [Paralvinella palmiformis]
MVLRHRKYESGAATAYISRKQALKKLQLSLPDFRRLCILKGIHPHEPRHPKTVGKGSTLPKTYYFKKDIQFLMHEPIINKFRDFKVFLRKLRKAEGKAENDRIDHLKEKRPKYKLDHIVKERYPSFIDAIRDLDDCLSMTFLFATFPKTRVLQPSMIQLCRRLTVEFMHYVIASKSLRKVFISIKGIYYQADILDQKVTWVVPHTVGYQHPNEVDFKIMVTFVEFYVTMLGFVNFRLFHSLGLYYPPKLILGMEQNHTDDDDDVDKDDNLEKDDIEERLSALTQSLQSSIQQEPEEVDIDEFSSELNDDPDHVEKAKVEQEKLNHLQSLFKGLKFFLNREVPRETLTFIIRSFGGQVSWDSTMAAGSVYQESDESITHHIVDRPEINKQYLSRYYIQPQWVFDSVNACRLLPVEDYFMGVILPPHLSPFVEEGQDDYIPPEKRKMLDVSDSGINNSSEDEESEEEECSNEGREDLKEGDDDENVSSDEGSDHLEKKYEERRLRKRKQEAVDHDEPTKKTKSGKERMSVSSGVVEKVNLEHKLEVQTNEERKLAEMMIPKKKRRLYKKIMYAKKKKAQEVKKLTEKREAYEKQQKRPKKKQS